MGRPREVDALDRALARLAATHGHEGDALVLRPFGRRSPLGALLAAIDETVLPRTLLIRNAAGETLSFDAARRRLIAVRPGPGAPVPPSAPDPNDASGLDLLGQALHDFAARAPLHLRQKAATDAAAAEGMRAADLATRWGAPMAAGPPPDPGDILDRLLDAHAGVIRACLIAADPAEAEADGEPQARALLDEFARTAAACPAAQRGGRLLAVSRSGYGLALLEMPGVALGLATEPGAADAVTADLQRVLLGWS